LQPYSHLATESLVSYAEVIGLDIGRFRQEITGQAHAAKIRADIAEGVRNGVNATPKFYVNGRRVDGKVPLEHLVELVEAAVSAERAKPATGG